MFLLFNAVDYIMWSLSWLSSGSVGKESACNAGDKGDPCSIPRLGRSPGGGNGKPLQFSYLKNPLVKVALWAIVQKKCCKESDTTEKLSTTNKTPAY